MPASTPPSPTASAQPPQPGKRQRRSARLMLAVPVLVYGWASSDTPFWEITKTLSVSAHGGLLEIGEWLERDQTILLVNSATQEERKCRVVYTTPKEGGRNNVGFEFLRTTGNFWGLTYDSQQGTRSSEEPRARP